MGGVGIFQFFLYRCTISYGLRVGVGQPKIDNFDSVAVIQQHILRFEIPMDNIEPMHILDAVYYLVEVSACIPLVELLLFGDEIE